MFRFALGLAIGAALMNALPGIVHSLEGWDPSGGGGVLSSYT